MIETILKTKQISDPHSLTKFKDGSAFLTKDYRLYNPLSLNKLAKQSYGTILKGKKYFSLFQCKHNNYCICRNDKIAGCHLCKMEKTENTKIELYGDKTYNNRKQFKETNLKKFGFENYNQQPSRKQEIIIEQHNMSKKTSIPIISDKGFVIKGRWRGVWTNKVGVPVRYSFKCLKCGNIIRRGGNYIKSLNCPKCNPKQSSQFEKDVYNYITTIYKSKIELKDSLGEV